MIFFHLKLGKMTYFMSISGYLAYLSMLKPPNGEEPKTSKGPSRTRRESAVDFGAFLQQNTAEFCGLGTEILR